MSLIETIASKSEKLFEPPYNDYFEDYKAEFIKSCEVCRLNPNTTRKIIKCGGYENDDVRGVFLQHPLMNGSICMHITLKFKKLDQLMRICTLIPPNTISDVTV